MQAEVDAIRERLLAEWGGERRVDKSEGSADRTEFVEVGQFQARVRRRFGNDQHCLARNDRVAERSGRGDVDESDVDAEALAWALQECKGACIELPLSNDVAAGRTERQHRGSDCTHAGPERKSGLGALEFGDCVLKLLDRWVGVTAVEIAVTNRGSSMVSVVEAV